MAIYLTELQQLIDSFNHFKKVFIDNKKCIFTDQVVFTKENIAEYRKQIVENYDATKRHSSPKYRDQIKRGMKNSDTFKLFFANLYYLYDMVRETSIELKVNRLCLFLECENEKFSKYNINDKEISKILTSWHYDKSKVESLISQGQKIDSTAYYTNMYYEMNFIFGFFESLSLHTTDNYKNIIDNLKFENLINLEDSHSKTINKFVARNYLLYLFYPDRYEPILSYKDKEQIVTFYKGSIIKNNFQQLDDDLLNIRESLEWMGEDKGFYHNLEWKNISISYNYKNRKNLLEKIEDINSDDLDNISNGDEREATIKTRIGQSQFRNKLIQKYGKCCICEIKNNDLLIASHIKPWSESNPQEKTDYQNNGLLLCPQHDKLFDKGYISFTGNGTILISSLLNQNEYKLVNIQSDFKLNIELNNQLKIYMNYHKDKKFKA